jgi:DNA-directed RNA polymerase specialized sigma24 family protein
LDRHDSRVDAFTGFVEAHEAGLRNALTACLGWDVGREATAEALAYGWENWERVSTMDNPIGYLYRVGRNKGRRMRPRRPIAFPLPATVGEPWIEPGLPGALAALPERQRVVVWMLHSLDLSMSQVASTLGITKGTVQRHAERGMASLRSRMGVPT